MSWIAITNNSTLSVFSGGVTGIAPENILTRVVIGGSWNVGDSFTFNIATAGQVYTCGIGYITGVVPVMAMTLAEKVNFISGTVWYFSDSNNPLGTEQQNPGAGFIDMANEFSMPENLVSLCQYQGMMCVQSRRTTQIWEIDANPANYVLFQTLANIGNLSPQGAAALGELDVVFPYDNGIRSLRVRTTLLNASVSDIGAAIDNIIKPLLLNLSQSQLQQCAAITEPDQNRYWCFIPSQAGSGGTIFVLSYFPSNKIVAWSQYTAEWGPYNTVNPTSYVGATVAEWNDLILGHPYLWIAGPNETVFYCGGHYYTSGTIFNASSIDAIANYNTTYTGTLINMSTFTFNPQKFVIWQGQVYICDANSLFIWGGADNNTYDYTQATLQLPFYDEKRTDHRKTSTSVSADVTGNFQMFATPDWINGTSTFIGNLTQATFDQGIVPFEDTGSHFSFIFTSYGNEIATVTAATLNYQLGEDPKVN